MGKKKLEIKPKRTKEDRQITFSKRRMGLEKKAQELAILCGTPLLLLLFSPCQRLSWVSSSSGTPEEIIQKYAQMPYEERNKRKIQALEELKPAFKKLDSGHNINLDNFPYLAGCTTQDVKHNSTTSIQQHLADLLQKLRELETPKTLEEANEIEGILKARLMQIGMYQKIDGPESKQPLLAYDQVSAEGKCMPSCEQGLVQGNGLSPVAQIPGNMAVGEENWQSKYSQNFCDALITSINDQCSRATSEDLSNPCDPSSWLTNSMIPPQDYLPKALNHDEDCLAISNQVLWETNDIKAQNMILEEYATLTHATSPIDGNHALESFPLEDWDCPPIDSTFDSILSPDEYNSPAFSTVRR
ncbi:hypothetical protein KP509_06G037700 [Ceratopteris richardii]|uniref:MADS-box domain-containing protein n=1 Tax=Ceratopteris richardii TaxID=49495 RepID=A0A8T2URS0_CERRI|nr:hypothetical protein KP509_06G037700 [Ceratopteris richardii]